MGIKLGKSAKLPGDTLIGTGIIFCGLSFAVYVITSLNGLANGLIFSGGGILGLLIICVGYLKRISEALTVLVDASVAIPSDKH